MGVGIDFLDQPQETMLKKRDIKIRLALGISAHRKTSLKNEQSIHRLGLKYFQNIYLTQDWFPGYVKNSCKPMIKSQKWGKIWEKILHKGRCMNDQ